MNTRQQLYKKYRLQGMSKYAAARKAGYSHSTAKQATRIEDAIDMPTWLEMEGLTDAKLAEHAKQGLNATKIVGYLHQYKRKGKRGKLEKIQPDEIVSNEFIEVPDWSVRHRYFETILKLSGKLKDTPLIDQSQHYHLTLAEIVRSANETSHDRGKNSVDAEMPKRA